MTPEQIIEMAKQAICYDKHDKLFWGDAGQIQDFAKLVRNAVLEEAAKVCEVNHHTIKRNLDSFECATEIRSLKS